MNSTILLLSSQAAFSEPMQKSVECCGLVVVEVVLVREPGSRVSCKVIRMRTGAGLISLSQWLKIQEHLHANFPVH